MNTVHLFVDTSVQLALKRHINLFRWWQWVFQYGCIIVCIRLGHPGWRQETAHNDELVDVFLQGARDATSGFTRLHRVVCRHRRQRCADWRIQIRIDSKTHGRSTRPQIKRCFRHVCCTPLEYFQPNVAIVLQSSPVVIVCRLSACNANVLWQNDWRQDLTVFTESSIRPHL